MPANGVDFDLGEAVRTKSHEIGVYVEDEFDVTEALRINAGCGTAPSSRRALSPATFILPEDDPLAATTPPDQIRYSPGDIVAQYGWIRTAPLPALDDRAKKLHQGGHRAKSPVHPPGFPLPDLPAR